MAPIASQAFEAWRSDAVDACAALTEMGPVLLKILLRIFLVKYLSSRPGDLISVPPALP